MKFSKNAHIALTIAKDYANKFNSKNVSTEHLLTGLIESEDDTLIETFNKLNVSPDHIKEVINSILSIDEINKSQKLSQIVEFTPRCTKIIEFAKGIAQKLNKSNVEVIDLFLSLLYENDGVAVSILHEYGLDFISVKSIFKKEFGDEIEKTLTTDLPESISSFIFDISKEAELGNLNTKFVRDIDYEKLFMTLGKKHNTNLIITGDPGVGKKDIVNEIARRICKKQAPESICNKIILEIKLKSLISGTKYRGDFESRMEILQDFLKNNSNIILFISDISLITRIEGTTNIEEYFSELFEIDDINFIGLCDTDNFKKHIDKISAIVNNFEVFNVSPTDKNETLEILNNNIKIYEDYHGVKYKKDVLNYAIEFSSRYITDKSQPTSSINLIDECGAYVKIRNQNIDETIIKNSRELQQRQYFFLRIYRRYK